MFEVFPNELSLWQKKGALLLDVRSEAEYASGHIPGARNIPLERLLEELDTLQSPIITLCATGNRAGLAAEVLEYEGFEAGKLVGGVQGYAALGYRLERSKNLEPPFRPEEAPCT
ncbi:MAG: rhodanese-like domain-containing protein [Meiothermus sp.]|uniref:rhodanese-like domain-containing protein n=1 Tax=Meiothermus sp. TaxID=1955249 RepID=UPI0025D57AE5|nr:rhodanese-like domain-containing protein [Meiothermus sp.]MCS7067865.1 rhodanese-like domain-containing protein [Meiothermus sp.]MCX7600570.1 rhodanese-like domain-containing protein [Meiothermus sp.]MDW8424745.1 rhodanese-like domain-containing protein [Meiothermus sp.]